MLVAQVIFTACNYLGQRLCCLLYTSIPGADPALVARLGLLADRISINIEIPSERRLSLLAPDKSKRAILAPMKQVSQSVTQSKAELLSLIHI